MGNQEQATLKNWWKRIKVILISYRIGKGMKGCVSEEIILFFGSLKTEPNKVEKQEQATLKNIGGEGNTSGNTN